MAATDSYRLAEIKDDRTLIKQGHLSKNAEAKIISFPRSAFQNLERILSGYPNQILSINIQRRGREKYSLFVIGDGEIEITSSLVEGIYPDYRKLAARQSLITEVVCQV